jgi:hypothetical protein
VTLTVEPAEAGWTWVVRLENRDTVPLRVVGDARLLSLEIAHPPSTRKGRTRTIHCSLPPEMRPSTDEEQVQIVPPTLAYTETFDPRLYCFEMEKVRELRAGATVVAHFGFGPNRARYSAPPFVVATEDEEPGRGASKEVVSEPFILPESPRAPDADSEESALANDSHPSPLKVSTPKRVDASGLHDLTLPITVTNTSPRPVSLLLRPETLAIDVTGPSGTTRCQWLIIPSPIAELFTTLAPKESASTEVLVPTLCPSVFFDRPGLYTFRAAIDTRRASGASIGLRTFDDQVWSPSTTLVRLRAVRP